MAVICPTVLAGNARSFRLQMEKVAKFANRIQIDLMDGEFAPHKSISLEQVWWPVGVKADLHIMYKNPNQHLQTIVELNPNLAIFHTESKGDFYEINETLKVAGIKVGLALLKQSATTRVNPVLDMLDHVLIFSGDLGKFGGRADLEMLKKVQELKAIRPDLEIGWDGGINQHNVKDLAEGGVDVLNVGGFIQRSEHPDQAYAKLEEVVGN